MKFLPNFREPRTKQHWVSLTASMIGPSSSMLVNTSRNVVEAPPLFCTYRKLSSLKPPSTFSYRRRSSCHHQQWSSHYESAPETRSSAQRKHPTCVSVHLEERSGQSVCEGQFGSGVCGARDQSKLVIFSAFLFSSSAYFRKGWELTWFTTNVVNGSQHSTVRKTCMGKKIYVSILKSTSF